MFYYPLATICGPDNWAAIEKYGNFWMLTGGKFSTLIDTRNHSL